MFVHFWFFFFFTWSEPPCYFVRSHPYAHSKITTHERGKKSINDIFYAMHYNIISSMFILYSRKIWSLYHKILIPIHPAFLMELYTNLATFIKYYTVFALVTVYMNSNNNCMVQHIFISAWKVFMSSIIHLQPFLATCANTGANNNIYRAGVYAVTRYHAHTLRNRTRACLYWDIN